MGQATIFQINASNGGVPKLAVQQAQVTFTGLAVDRQRNLEVHGGPERALCLFSLEKILALQLEGHPIFPGAIGENITLRGIDWEDVVPGLQLGLGDTLRIEVTRYTTPCNNLVPYFIQGSYDRVSQNHYPGWSRVYAKILQEGSIQVGDRLALNL